MSYVTGIAPSTQSPWWLPPAKVANDILTSVGLDQCDATYQLGESLLQLLLACSPPTTIEYSCLKGPFPLATCLLSSHFHVPH